MKFILAASLLIGAALCNSIAFYGWRPNQEFLYKYESQVLTGVPELRHQYAGLKLASDVIVQTYRDYSLRIKFVNPKFVVVNEELQVRNGRPQVPKPEKEVPETLRRFLTEPFEVHLKRGVVETLFVSKDEPVAVTNIKKSLLAQLQIDVTASRKNEIPSELSQEILEQATRGDDESKTFFATEETTLTGDCATEYTIHRLPQYQANEIESTIEVSQKELERSGDISGEKSEGKEICRGKKYFEITKTKNLDNCRQRPVYQSTTGFKAKCDFSGSHCLDALTQIVTTRYVVCGESLEDFVIREVETNNDVVTNPIGYQVTEERMTMAARVSMTLLNLKSGNFQPLPKPQNVQEKKSLIFQFPRGDAMSSKGSQGIAPGQSLREGDFVPILPMPDLTTGENILPSSMPFNVLKEKISRELREIAQEVYESPESCPSKKDVAGKVSSIAYYLRPLSLNKLKELEREIFESMTDDQKKIAADLFVDILSMTGSNPCVMLLKEKLERGNLGPMKSSKVVQEIMRTIRTPTVELLKEMFQMVKNLKTQSSQRSQRVLFNIAATQLANLVQNACVSPTTRVTMFPARVYGIFCTEKTEFVTNELIPWLVQELEQSQKETDRLVMISVLGKLGHPKILLPLARVIQGERIKSPMTRSVAVYSLKRLAKVQPTLVKPMLLRIIDNPAENTEVRIAAISILPWAKPSTSDLQKIAVRSWFEPSKQVASFIYTTLKSLVETEVPELKPVGLEAQNALSKVKPFQWGIQFSHNTHTQAFVKYLRIAHSVETSYVSTTQTLTPARLAFSSRMFGGSWQIDGLTFNIYTKGMDTFIDNSLVKMGYQSSASSEVKEQLKQIEEKLNIRKRNKDQPEMLLQFGTMGLDRVYALDQEIYDEIVEKVTEKLNNYNDGMQDSNLNMNITFAQKSFDIEVVGPCEAGLAVLVKRNVPNVIGIKGRFQTQTENGVVRSIMADIVPVINSKLQADMGVLFPFTKEFIGSGVEQSMHVSLPTKMKATVRSLSEIEAVWSTPKEISNKFELGHYFMRPYTVTKSTQDIKPISKSSQAKTILTGENMQKTSMPLGKKLGLSALFTFESDNSMLNFPYLLNLYSQNDIVSLLTFGTTLPSVKYTSLKMEYSPRDSLSKEIVSTFMIVHGRKTQEDSYEMSFPSEEEVGPHQEQKIQKICKENNQRYEDVELCVEEKKEQLESRREGHKSARGMLEKLSQGSFASGLQVKSSIRSAYGTRHTIKAQAMFGSETEGEIINSHVDLKLTVPSQQVYFIKAKSAVTLPRIPFRWNIQSLLDQDIHMKTKLDLVYGKEGSNTEEFKVDMDLIKSEELRRSVESSPEMRKCIEEVSRDHELSSVCDEARHQAASVDKIRASVQVPASWARNPLAFRLLAAGEALLFPSTTLIDNGRQQSGDNFKFDAEIQFNRTGTVFQGKIEGPGKTYIMKNVTLSRPLQKIFPLSLRNNVTYRLLQDVTRDQAPASCRLEHKIVSTFDNKTYAYEMTNCEHLLFKDCSSYQLRRPLAVLAKAASRGGSKKIVKILSGHYIVELKPAAAHRIGGSVSVFINGHEEKVDVMQTVVKRSPNSRTIELAIHRFKDGVVSVKNPVEGLEVLFDSKKIEIVGPQVMHNRVCGLCGDLNLENTADLKSPQECIMSEPRFSGYSYRINEDSCDSNIPEHDKQRFEEDKRQCTKARSVPTPVETLAKNLYNNLHRVSKSLAHIVEKRVNEICFSQIRLRICHERDEAPVKMNRKPISFVCMPKSNGIVISLLNKAKAGEDVSIYLQNQRIQYTKTIAEPQSCKLVKQ